MRIIDIKTIEPSAWKNGGGITREVLAFPNENLWNLRISLAEISDDGPFSQFEDATRHLAILEGEGITLEFGYELIKLTAFTTPLTFYGDNAPFCRLISGKTNIFNVIVKMGRASISATVPLNEAQKGFLVLESSEYTRYTFLWFGEEPPPIINAKGLWVGYTPTL